MGESRDLRKRLDALNRRPLPPQTRHAADVEEVRRKLRKTQHEVPEPSTQPIQYRRDIPREEPAVRRRRLVHEHIGLTEGVQGEEVLAPDGGPAYVIAERPSHRGEYWTELCEKFCESLRRSESGVRRRLAELCCAPDFSPGELIFVDLETTGLAGTPLFLIGTMTVEDGGLLVRQYLARDYSEERAVISLFLDVLSGKRLLVSFNGKSFDLPYVRVRAVANGMPFEADLPHLDLLHECRRAWRHALPDCKLQTLERHICGRARHSDIPGCEIPEAYHAFVRTSNAAEMVEILEHNVLDLLTLADLLLRLPGHNSRADTAM